MTVQLSIPVVGMDGAIAYGKPGVRCPLWLQTCIDKEMEYLHDIIKGGEITEEYEKLLNGVAALESIATADACTLSVKEDRKVRLSGNHKCLTFVKQNSKFL